MNKELSILSHNSFFITRYSFSRVAVPPEALA
jgi:hypothetical protein